MSGNAGALSAPVDLRACEAPYEARNLALIRGVDMNHCRLPKRTGRVEECVLLGKPAANEILAEEGLGVASEVLSKAPAQYLFPETLPGELRFLPLGLQGMST